MNTIRKLKGCPHCGSPTKHKKSCPDQQIINAFKDFKEFDKYNRRDIVTMIPRDKIPKRISSRPKHKIDHYDFEGDFNIKILDIKTKGVSYPTINPYNKNYYRNLKGGDSQK